MPTNDNTTADPADLFRTRNLAERLYIDRQAKSPSRADARAFSEENAIGAIKEAHIFAKAWAVLGVRDGE